MCVCVWREEGEEDRERENVHVHLAIQNQPFQYSVFHNTHAVFTLLIFRFTALLSSLTPNRCILTLSGSSCVYTCTIYTCHACIEHYIPYIQCSYKYYHRLTSLSCSKLVAGFGGAFFSTLHVGSGGSLGGRCSRSVDRG